jgi:glycosyltransferase involved in cell wall biosynthesis
MRISAVMPAFNAANYLMEVFDRFPVGLWENLESLWVINDGSSDDTAVVLREASKKYRAVKPCNYVLNRGYGVAVQRGLRLCREENVDVVAVIHADGQYPPEVVADFARTMIDKKIDILQGSRIASGTALSGGMPLYKFIAGKILTFIENVAFGLKMSDYHSGFILYSSKALQTINFERLSTSFDFDLEMIASARAKRLTISELPIPTRYAGEKSYLNPVTYGMRVLMVIGKFLLGFYK